MFDLSAKAQKVLGWAIVVIAALAFIAGVYFIFRGHVSNAVDQDRAVSGAVINGAQVNAERAAQADAEQDKLVAERARQQQMEAINESMHEPGGDPTAAVYDRLRRSAPPAR